MVASLCELFGMNNSEICFVLIIKVIPACPNWRAISARDLRPSERPIVSCFDLVGATPSSWCDRCATDGLQLNRVGFVQPDGTAERIIREYWPGRRGSDVRSD